MLKEEPWDNNVVISVQIFSSYKKEKMKKKSKATSKPALTFFPHDE